MKIGELSRESGLTATRIRFYESAGLIPPAERRPNGYRHYPRETLRTLQIIATAQSAGFKLDEIRSLLPPPDHLPWVQDTLLVALKRKVAEIEAMQRRLKASRAQLLAIIETIETRPDDADCSAEADKVIGLLS
jgi:DNA-binding transcriptional MerR regulator